MRYGGKRIAVLRAGALGDFLLGIPALLALRRRYPEAEVHLAGPLPQARLALVMRAADALTDVDDPALAALFGAPSLPPRLPAALAGAGLAVVWLRRAEVVAANLERAGVEQVLAAPPFPPAGAAMHVADWLMHTLAPLDVPPLAGWDAAPWLAAPDDALAWADRWLKRQLDDRPFAVLHPGSGSPRKNWPPANWLAVAKSLQDSLGLSLLVTAGPADDAALASILQGRPAEELLDGRCRTAVLANPTLCHLAAVLRRATVYLGNDSGVTHLAAGLGTPTLAVFGPTDPAIWRPRGPRVAVLGGSPDISSTSSSPNTSSTSGAPGIPGATASTGGAPRWPSVAAVLPAAARLATGGQPLP